MFVLLLSYITLKHVLLHIKLTQTHTYRYIHANTHTQTHADINTDTQMHTQTCTDAQTHIYR